MHIKRIIRSSNLSLRFYVMDGWTKEELDEMAPRGNAAMPFPKDHDPYFIFRSGHFVDVGRILERCSKLIRAFDDYPTESDRQFMVKHL
jgi:hypothetical protein